MKFAIAIPQFYADGEFDPAAFRAYLARAEELGFESAWAQEQILGSGSWSQFSPLEAMTYAAACTERLRLGCVVFVSTLHNPVHLAKALATVDQLSRGRVEVGVGTGGKVRPFAAFGVDPARYVARFTEGITLMKALWTEPGVTFDGEFWQIQDQGIEPGPFQKPHPPLWFGAAGPAAVRRAVRLGTGFFGAGSSPTVRFAEQVTVVQEALGDAGRPPESFPIAKRVYITIDDDAGRARARTDATLERLYGFRSEAIEAAAIAGTVGDCVGEVRRSSRPERSSSCSRRCSTRPSRWSGWPRRSCRNSARSQPQGRRVAAGETPGPVFGVIMACSMFITAQDSTLTQSVASRPYGSGWPQVYFTVLVPGLQLLPCVGLSAHQHQSMSSAVSHAWMLA